MGGTLVSNIVLLTADSLRADHVSSHGYERETTPNIDALADANTQFMRAYSPSSHTRESVGSILSGRYPDEAIDERYAFDAEGLAEKLDDHATAAFHSNPFISEAYGYDDGFDEFFDDLRIGSHWTIALAQRLWDILRNHNYVRADELNERALSWVDSLDDDEDFFLWVHYMDTHGPFEPPEPHRSEFFAGSVGGREGQRLYRRAAKHPEEVTDETREMFLDLYDGEIHYFDHHVDDLVDSLRRRGRMDESLLLLSADHGEEFGEHGQYSHPAELYDELTHVPLVVSGPGFSAADVDVPVSLMDVVPTALEFLGEDVDGYPGVPLQAVASDPSEYADRVVFCEARGEDDDSDVRRFSARRQGSDPVFVEWSVSDDELLGVSPADAPADLRDRLESFVADRMQAGTTHSPELGDEIDSEVERRLEAIGYKE
ncbi:sulfatase [Halobaculum sp. P14]|uniref:sulfatase n=1 Tax=Halobaculum sp. P14 TaxID=3421638 RepID=UPI003EB8632D